MKKNQNKMSGFSHLWTLTMDQFNGILLKNKNSNHRQKK